MKKIIGIVLVSLCVFNIIGYIYLSNVNPDKISRNSSYFTQKLMWSIIAGGIGAYLLFSNKKGSDPNFRTASKRDNEIDALMGGAKSISKEKFSEERLQRLTESGDTNFRQKAYNQAAIDYSLLIQMQPNNGYAYLKRGASYYRQGNPELALADLNKSVELLGDNFKNLFYRGWTNLKLKNYQDAIADFTKMVQIDSSSYSGYYGRGVAKAEKGDYVGSISDYDKSIQMKSDYSSAYNNRGWSKFKLGKYREAMVDLDRAAQSDPNNWAIFDSRQEIKFALDDLFGCVDDCNTSLKLNAKSSNSYFFRGQAHFRLGNKSKACSDWNKAGELGMAEAYEQISRNCNY